MPESTPPPAPPLGLDNLPSVIRSALERSFSDRNDGEIAANRVVSAPLPSRMFCDSFAEGYDGWFRRLHAGIMSPSPVGLPALKSGLRSFGFLSWGPAFAAYWSSTVWTPTGVYTGGVITNALDSGTGLQNEINTMLSSGPGDSSNRSLEDFSNRIANVVHSYTTKLLVQATLSIPPGTKIETVI